MFNLVFLIYINVSLLENNNIFYRTKISLKIAQSLPNAHTCLVIILFTDTAEEFATISENWKVDKDIMCYQNFKFQDLKWRKVYVVFSHLIRCSFPYRLLKICDKLSGFLRVKLLHSAAVSNV